jgi:hypothetical protein
MRSARLAAPTLAGLLLEQHPRELADLHSLTVHCDRVRLADDAVHAFAGDLGAQLRAQPRRQHHV